MAKKAKKAKVKPTYMKGKKPMKIGLHDVIRALKVIDDHGHMDKFTKAAKKKKAMMLIEPATVNFVKDFIVKNDMHAHPVGKHIANPRVAPRAAVAARKLAAAPVVQAKDPFECDFSKH
ncbi:hypothetical protein [Bradyrhizobium sp. AZCC 1721]|uniref:hypothetical protein n=1 Tax=Bradyrhizobium sp. AZCC 1721 TaxID=3117016 RepID=UPI002FEEC433